MLTSLFLLALLPVDVNLYTVRGPDLFRVRLSDGWTDLVYSQLGDTDMVAWDSDTRLLYGTSGWVDDDGEDLDFFALDLNTWTLTSTGYISETADSGFQSSGVQLVGYGIQDPVGQGITSLNQISAYDPTTALVWTYENPLQREPGHPFPLTISAIDPIYGRQALRLFRSANRPGQTYTGPPSNQFSMAFDPINGTLYTSGITGDWFAPTGSTVTAIDTTNWTTNTITLNTAGLQVGPIAFYPGSHNLMIYTYDGSGYAWLSTVDLVTGDLTQATPQFWAPAWFIFFREE